jgi:hypothetical protein
MLPLVQQYSLSDFVTHWAAETGEDPGRVTVVIAQAILEHLLVPNFHDSNDPNYRHRNSCMQHLRRVALGIEPPDLAGRLHYVVLPAKDLEEWLLARGQGMSIVGQTVEGESDASLTALPATESTVGRGMYDNLQKVVALQALLLASLAKKFKHGDKPNATQIQKGIEAILDANPDLRVTLGSKGLSKSSVIEKIGEALKLFEKNG